MDKRKSRRRRTNRDALLQDAYQVIWAEVSKLGRCRLVITRDELANALLRSDLKDRLLERSTFPGRDQGNPFETAANYVDWFSADLSANSPRTSQWYPYILRARAQSSHPLTNRRRDVWAYLAREPTFDGLLSVSIEPTGLLSLGTIGPDNDWTRVDWIQQRASGLLTVSFGHWADILKELEFLISDPACEERQLQKFFENHPGLLMGLDYKRVISEAVIHRDVEAVTSRKTIWEADFVLAPHDPEHFCKILELKRPQLPSIRKRSRGHARFTKALHEGIQQLHDYHRAFDSIHTRRQFRNDYHVEVFRPDLHLIIGRRWDYCHNADMLAHQKTNFLRISSWDSMLDAVRRILT